MIKLDKKEMCSGCHACYNICPKKCISMKTDTNGFIYPEVDVDECIKCGMCEKVCNGVENIKTNNNPVSYACYNLDDTVRIQSSSGGIFTLLAEAILEKKGAVFGAAFNQKFQVNHICIEQKKDLYRLRGSKYVQSIIGECYKDAKERLEKGQAVLFTGTPCQIDGLHKYLMKDYEKLYTQDLICHGVPSYKIWRLYLKYQENHNDSTISNEILPSFRDKANGWVPFSMFLKFDNEKVYRELFKNDPYMKAFLNNLCLRPSCYACNSKQKKRSSDITLADFWGVDEVLPDMYNSTGTSLVIVNSKKGNELLSLLRGSIIIKEVNLEQAVSHNTAAYLSVTKPKKREKFLMKVNDRNFNKLVTKMTELNLFEKVIWKVNHFLKNKK